MNKLMQQKLPIGIFLMGPTSSGKTELAISLREYLPIEIISVDSAMIYKNMDIGTAKPNIKIREKVPHRLIDIIDPSVSYSAADFRNDAIREMTKIKEKNRIPLLVGGTMLYFKVLLEGLSPLPKSNLEVRTYLRSRLQKEGQLILYRELKKIDPIAADNIHPNDIQRLLRAMEVYFTSGKTITELIRKPGKKLAYKIYQFAIFPYNRILLHHRIEDRFYKMISSNFEQEVRFLFSRSDLNINMPSIRCIGYRQMWEYLSKEINYNNMIFKVISATKQLAKRQITWLQNWPKVHWIDSEQPIIAIKKIVDIVKKAIE